MLPSQMRTAVLQAVIIETCSNIVGHHWSVNIYDTFASHELFSNFTTAAEANARAIGTNTTYHTQTETKVINGTSSSSLSLVSTTETTFSGFDLLNEESFYTYKLPRDILIFVVILSLQYCWHTWLERVLPGRPRGLAAIPEGSENFDLGDGGDTREAEIVKKWIDQGKVRRLSLSWRNTFFKWMLDVTIGALWSQGLDVILSDWLRLRSPAAVRNGMKSELLIRFASSFIFLEPVASLISFIIIPAHKRIVFLTATGLLTSCFTGAFLHSLISWSANSSFVRTLVQDLVEGMNNETAAAFEETARNELSARRQMEWDSYFLTPLFAPERLGDEL